MRMALEELKRLQSPYLQWAGKAERTQFEVDTVSLHVHERIDPASILAAVRKGMKDEGKPKAPGQRLQYGLFDAPFENLPLRDAITQIIIADISMSLDNVLAVHARNAFTGPRKVMTAMAIAQRAAELAVEDGAPA